MLTGAAIEVPVVASAVYLLAQLGVGNPDVPFTQLVRYTALFAGVAALLTAGGIGRLAAYAFVDGGRRRAVIAAARAHAAASIGLVVIAAIPHGQMPDKYDRLWLAYPVAGVIVGVLCGTLIGLVCSSAAPVGLADVWSLARAPTRVGTRALKTLLSPEDLVRLGSALRTRTSQMFEGIFDPAPRPPDATAPAKPPGEPAPATPGSTTTATAATTATATATTTAAATTTTREPPP
ncbi:MAG: hypothetical protein KF773_31355 [Deltaproteobacteria bacterium]|nr:hypothetical protein [Deltaproteobacteria bacterium]MCW5807448.1 hypothetical protein [Deltaproteobacteria bacterium]